MMHMLFKTNRKNDPEYRNRNQTHIGGRFLHFDNEPDNTKRIMVFTTLPGLDLLSGADDWLWKFIIERTNGRKTSKH